jgi:hypothetical protein
MIDPKPFIAGFVIAVVVCAALATVEAMARSDAARANAAAQKKAIEAAHEQWAKCIDTSEEFALQATHGGDAYCVWQSKGPLGRMRLEKL